MAKDSNVQWSVIHTETLPADISAAYKSYKSAYAAMKDARDEFEIALRAALRDSTPKGKRLAIAYNFGKLSVAIVDDDRKSASPKSAISLADLAKRLHPSRTAKSIRPLGASPGAKIWPSRAAAYTSPQNI